MASTKSGGEHRLSFAKIAAMPPPPKMQPSVTPDRNSSDAVDQGLPHLELHAPKAALSAQDGLGTAPQEDTSSIAREINGLERAVESVQLEGAKDQEESESSVEPQANGILKREQSFDDDRTHLSNSSTKPTSFDSKSMASVTTFAMDEKDSLRPDDSASVQAVDEEESLSGPASGAPNSLIGSESGARPYRDQFRDGTVQRGVLLPGSGRGFNDGLAPQNLIVPADSISNNFIVQNPEFPAGRSLHGFPLEPDEKLLEAMKSPKDRLLILQLEEKIRHFIQDSNEQSLELPPSNGFGRLLAHKLGDYYHLTHFVDNNVTSVRLHRTPFCRLPTPLSVLHASTNTTPPPMVPTMKIMRRNGQNGERSFTDGSTAASSSAPSKATSEDGESGNDGEPTGSSAGATPAKDRMTLTREEREAKYQEARERIFRDFPESKPGEITSGEQSANMSRSSSTSGRKKTYRQKTPHDDSFEARSQFNAYYPGMHYANGPNSYNVAVNDGSYPQQPPYMVGPGVSAPGMSYAQNGQQNVMYPGPMNMNTVPQYQMAASPQMSQNVPWQGGNLPQQSPYTGYASMNQSPVMIGQQSSTKSSPAMSNYALPNPVPYQSQGPTWPSPPYQGNFPSSAHRNHPPVHWPNYPSHAVAPSTASYSYAQFPGQTMNPGMPNHAGSHQAANFGRSPFNPQTRSFVPGGVPPTRHLGKHMQPGVIPYHNGQSQWTGYPDPGMKPMEPMMAAGYNAGRPGPPGNRDSIAKWGTPSHLPPKPPPSEVPSEFEMKHRSRATPSVPYANNTTAVAKNGPLVVSGGVNLPKPA